MFYLTTSSFYLYVYLASENMVMEHSDNRKEGNILFNDTLNTFYLQLYGIRHMVTSKGSFICIIPDRIAHTTAFVTPVVEHWLEREIAQWVHPMKDRAP